MAVGGVTETLSADGQSTARSTIGKIRVYCSGTFGGGSAQVQLQDPDDTWLDVDTALTAAGDVIIDIPPGVQNRVRVDLSGATGPTLEVWVQSADDL